METLRSIAVRIGNSLTTGWLDGSLSNVVIWVIALTVAVAASYIVFHLVMWIIARSGGHYELFKVPTPVHGLAGLASGALIAWLVFTKTGLVVLALAPLVSGILFALGSIDEAKRLAALERPSDPAGSVP
jgi:hypothetical protein